LFDYILFVDCLDLTLVSQSKGDDSDGPPPNLDEAVKKANAELTNENKSLNCLVTSLHEKHHTMSLKVAEMKDKLDASEAQMDELKNRIDEVEFELNRTRLRVSLIYSHYKSIN